MVLEGKREMLVGMVPLRIDSNEQALLDGGGKLEFHLAALQVAAVANNEQNIPYFVSPVHNLVSVTEAQEFGNWQFLLPGKYVVEVNGTRMEVELAAQQSLVIQPAQIRVSTPKNLDLGRAAYVRGAPTLVEINSGHWLELNEVFAVLPGPATLRLADSTRRQDIVLQEGQLLEQKVRAVLVQMDCSPWEWSCIGSRKIQLFERDQFYPFAEGVTDAPLLFFASAAWLGIEGSRDIRYQITKDAEVSKLKIGLVKLKPQPEVKAGVVTDLVRVDASGLPFSGFTLDVALERDTTIPLIVGQYSLTSFVTSTTTEGERRRSMQPFNISYGNTLEIDFPVYLSEKRYASLYEREKVGQQGARATLDFFSSHASDLPAKFRIK